MSTIAAFNDTLAQAKLAALRIIMDLFRELAAPGAECQPVHRERRLLATTVLRTRALEEAPPPGASNGDRDPAPTGATPPPGCANDVPAPRSPTRAVPQVRTAPPVSRRSTASRLLHRLVTQLGYEPCAQAQAPSKNSSGRAEGSHPETPARTPSRTPATLLCASG